MTTGQWDRLRTLFDTASGLARDERGRLAEEQTDPDIRRELQLLLSAIEGSEEFLERPLLAAPEKLHRFGPYRAIRKIGQGGMGAVWLASRDDGEFDHTVAVKVIRGGADSPDLVRRFRQERQALAMLRHPNIARLLDGGATEDGDPFLVMDYIEGLPLDRYAAEHQLPLHQRLELLVQLCRALEYAHGHKCLHRDIKPSNILVDRTGHLYLLDFGLARFLEDGPDAATRTRTIHRIMTPDYASPEILLGKDVTEASDVYSVGVVLYELIAGQRPYQIGVRSLEDLQSFFRTATIPQLDKSVSRDLQLLVHRVLHPDPERRYQTMVDLRADLERLLEGRTVLARPDSVPYRVTRWSAARPRLVRGIAAAALAVLLAGAAVIGQPRWRNEVLAAVTPAPHYSVLLAPFAVSSSLPGLDAFPSRLDAMFRAELAGGGVLNPVGGGLDNIPPDVNGHPGEAPLSPQYWPELRQKGADAVLTGAYELTDSSPSATLHLNVWLFGARGGKPLSHAAVSGSLAELESLVARACRQLSEDTGGEFYSIRSRHASARRRDADRLRAEGIARFRSFDLMTARARLEESVHRDASSVASRTALARVMEALGYNDDAEQQIHAAQAQAVNGSPEDRLEAAAVNAEMAEDWPKAMELRRELPAGDPDVSLALASDLLGARKLAELGKLIDGNIALTDPAIHAQWLLQRAWMIRWTAGRPGASQAVDDLMAAARALGSPIFLAESLYAASDVPGAKTSRQVSIDRLIEARENFARAGHREGVARTTATLGQRYHVRSKVKDSVPMLENALRDIEGAGFTEAEQYLRFVLASAFQHMDDLEGARRLYVRVLGASSRPFGRFDKNRILLRLGEALGGLGSLDEAHRRLEESLTPDDWANPNTIERLIELIDVDAQSGRPADVEKWLNIADEFNRRNSLNAPGEQEIRRANLKVLRGDFSTIDTDFANVPAFGVGLAQGREVVTQLNWGRALLAGNRPADAVKHLEIAVAAQDDEDEVAAATGEVLLATALARSHRVAEARRALAKASEVASTTQFAVLRIDYDLAAAWIDSVAGEHDRARATFQSVAVQCRKYGYLPRALAAEFQLAYLTKDTAASIRLRAEAQAAGIALD